MKLSKLIVPGICILGIVALAGCTQPATSPTTSTGTPAAAITQTATTATQNQSVQILPAQNQVTQAQTSQIQPAPQDPTAGWKTITNSQFGFEFKYPSGFFDLNQEPKILAGACNYSVFPDSCPNINEIVAKDQAAAGGDISAINSNLASPNYWKVPGGEKLTVNNVPYCLYQSGDAGMSHQYAYYYYATVTDKQCLVVNLNTSSTNCDVYLPLEAGNSQQQINYEDCLGKNRNQPATLSQIVSTFKFTNQLQSGCNTDSDCQNGASCLVEGPLVANQPIHRVCVPKGQAVPL
jgi:hypothetical protein